jgi:hypothetical protein
LRGVNAVMPFAITPKLFHGWIKRNGWEKPLIFAAKTRSTHSEIFLW